MHETSPSWHNGVSYAVVSDIGMRRANNQDSYNIALASTAEGWQSRGHLFVVADGMGAHAAGELASKIAVDTIAQSYRKRVDTIPSEAIYQAVLEANSLIHSRGQANAEFHGMGTTASVLLLLPQGGFVAHVGDSRVYRLRRGQLEQLSFDHSLVWEMMATGQIAEDQANNFVPKNIITRSLGPAPHVEADREGPYPLAVGDTFLLCSDGLTGQVTDDQLGQILATLEPPEAAQALVDLANLSGGPDNITVIVVKVTDESLAGDEEWTPAPTDAGGSRFWLFALAALAVVGAVLSAGLGYWVGFLLASVVAVFCGVLAFLIPAGSSVATNGGTHVEPPARYGRGPYRTLAVAPSPAFVDRLVEIIAQLNQVALDKQWSIDWDRFSALKHKAEQAALTRNLAEAVRQYCLAMSFMMNELRQQPTKHVQGPGV